MFSWLVGLVLGAFIGYWLNLVGTTDPKSGIPFRWRLAGLAGVFFPPLGIWLGLRAKTWRK